MQNFINVFSEIGALKKVLLHRPGKEIERLVPQYLERMLFDDIPYAKVARQEHDAFADTLRSEGVEVVYFTDLLKDTISNKEVRESLIKDYAKETLSLLGESRVELLVDYLNSLSIDSLLEVFTAGILKKDVPSLVHAFYDNGNEDDPFLIDPLPNLYFTRDAFASIGNGVTINHMHAEARRKESLLFHYIFRFHPEISKSQVPFWYNRTQPTSLEGGDELVLSKDSLAIGVSQRTNAASIESLAKTLFNSDQPFKKVYAINLPQERAFMHLDTVFTMVDHDKFVMHPAVMQRKDIRIFCLEPKSKTELKITEEKDLFSTLAKIIGKEPVLIPCGGGGLIDAARDQWNDGSNTLTVKPGTVVTYVRNELSNDSLREHGINVLSFSGPELVRGRGGPRCMSMPLYRENL